MFLNLKFELEKSFDLTTKLKGSLVSKVLNILRSSESNFLFDLRPLIIFSIIKSLFELIKKLSIKVMYIVSSLIFLL